VREASAELPVIARNGAELVAELRATAAEATALTQRLNAVAERAQPGLEATLASVQDAAAKLGVTATSLERIVAGNEASLAGLAGPGAAELQQLMFEVRDASAEVRALARTLRERPSSLVREPKEQGVEIPK
jgi:ABC-type transporter Mla subunit MlaD